MTPANDNLDKIREAWISMGQSLGFATGETVTTQKLDSMKTALDRLAEKYRRFSILAVAMILPSSWIFSRPDMVGHPWSTWLPVAYSIFFFIAFLIDHSLYTGIRSIDTLTMSVSQVAHKALTYKKRHLMSILILLPMAIAIISLTARAFAFDRYVILGMVAGGLVGLSIGIIQLTRFLRCYRQLSE